MSVSSSLSAILAVPIAGMALAASTLAPATGDANVPEKVVAGDAGAKCRIEARDAREFRDCPAGRWTKEQSFYQ